MVTVKHSVWRKRRHLIVTALGLLLILLAMLTGRPVASSFYPLAAPSEDIAADPAIRAMMNQVTTANLTAYVAGLSGEQPIQVGGGSYTLSNRNTDGGTPIRKATQYAYERLAADGLEVSYQVWDGSGYPNVIGEQRGSGQPSRVYLLTAHIDDRAESPEDLDSIAPGADDNASGTAAVLAIADILSHYRFTYTLRYVLFTGEEQGLAGSGAYACLLRSLEEDVAGVVNLDMIAYEGDGDPVMELLTRPGNAADLAIADLFRDVISAYGLDLSPSIIGNDTCDSDHCEFWLQDFPAILAIEDEGDFNPYYHTAGDTLARLDAGYYTAFSRAALGTMAHLAQPLARSRRSLWDRSTPTPVDRPTLSAMLTPNPTCMPRASRTPTPTTGAPARGMIHLPLIWK